MACALGQQIITPLACFGGVFHRGLPQGFSIEGAQNHRGFCVKLGAGHAFYDFQADDIPFIVVKEGFAFLFVPDRALFDDESPVLVAAFSEQVIECFVGELVAQ